jgi:predicted dehydrogenase
MIWLIGTGPMAIEYAKVLSHLKLDFTVIGRGMKNAGIFRTQTGIQPFTGGFDKYLSEHNGKPADFSIICTDILSLAETASSAVRAGVRNILLEKPGSLYKEKLEELSVYARSRECRIYIAYNRRFYSSVTEARKIILDDSGLTSMHFEFTELSHRITQIDSPAEIKSNWFMANSTHVVDLAFHLGGLPRELSAWTGGENMLEWHPVSSVFSGFGIGEKNVPFTYMADWNAPGRWSVELMTKNSRICLKPMEEIRVIRKGSFDEVKLKTDDDFDRLFKPGLYNMVRSFVEGENEFLPSIGHQIESFNHYYKISGYDKRPCPWAAMPK